MSYIGVRAARYGSPASGDVITTKAANRVRRRLAQSFLVALAVALATSCESEEGDTHSVEKLRDESTLCSSCVSLSPGPVLGDTSGPGYVVLTDQIVRDSLGRYWLGQYRDLIKVFDPDGRYVGTVGHEGQGPGEFRRPMPAVTDVNGMVHVFDPLNVRITVVDDSFQTVSTTRLPAMPRELGIALLPSSDTYVINASVRSVEAIGHPFHLVRGSEILKSFGSPETGITDARDILRVLTTDSHGRIFSARRDSFLVEVWTENGDHLASFEGPSLWSDRPNNGVELEHAPVPTLTDLYVDEGTETVWVIIGTPSPDWLDHMEVMRNADGSRSVTPLPGHDSEIYDTELVIIDLQSSSIIGRVTSPLDMPAFIGGGQMVEMRELHNGTPQLAVWTVELDLDSVREEE